MSRFRGSTWKVSRRLNYSISETGKELVKRRYAPGQHGQKRSKPTDYKTQLEEKQKIRFTYGVSEKQFRKTFNESRKLEGVHGENFLKLLESRLDNVVYRLGFARTRAQARQLVNHGHVLVDGKKVDIPSLRLLPGQTVSLKERSKNLKIVEEARENRHSFVEFVVFLLTEEEIVWKCYFDSMDEAKASPTDFAKARWNKEYTHSVVGNSSYLLDAYYKTSYYWLEKISKFKESALAVSISGSRLFSNFNFVYGVRLGYDNSGPVQ